MAISGGLAARRRAPVGAQSPALVNPVARVLADSGLAHLDRPFDYLVPERLDDAAVPGARVRVRFAGRLISGYLLDRRQDSDHEGTLSFLDRVVSAEPVLAPEIAELARAVADRYGGVIADVLRLAIPPRHAAAEQQLPPPTGSPLAAASSAPHPEASSAPHPEASSAPHPEASSAPHPEANSAPHPEANSAPHPEASSALHPEASSAGWARYPAGTAFLNAIADHRPARAVWQALPGEDWAARLADAAHTALAAGRGALVIVPSARDLQQLDAAMTSILGPGRHVALSADLGPTARYRRFLAVRRGQVSVAIGTRAAAFAPVRNLGLVAIFDDGDDLYSEQRAPYPHAREVLTLRSAQQHIPLVIGGFARTAEAQLLVESGWAHPIVASRVEVRRAAPRIEAAGDEHAQGSDSAAANARLTPAAFQAARAALDAGHPVLVQVPRRGYQPGLACVSCRRTAQCRACRGPLQLTQGSPTASCRWCGAMAVGWACPACASPRFRVTAIGAGRTAEELGRAFPGIAVVTSSGDHIHARIAAGPALVVATPGAEPSVEGGYGAALLLDGAAMLSRPDLRAGEETVRRWFAAATLVRPAAHGGRVIVGADSSLPSVQALIRWDPAGHARTELAARRELGFPPAVAMAAVEGAPAAVSTFLADLALPPDAEILGPVQIGGDIGSETERALIRLELGRGKELATALHTARAIRSARKDPAPARSRIDPLALW